MPDKIATKIAISLAIAGWALCSSAGMASESAQVMLGKISAYEDRFFFHQYPSDPGDKRLERLELLIFGSTQEGTLEERLARLSKAIVERDALSSSKTSQAKPPAPISKNDASQNKSSEQYAILNTLEWRVLKKTYPTDSLDERLGRLEAKIFGQASPAISYYDRVERLKKTLGIGSVTELPKGGMGPSSKARPGGQWGDSLPNSSIPNSPVPNIVPGFPEFGTDGMFGPLSDIMRQMQEKMSELSKLPSGTYILDPQTGELIEKNTGKRVPPNKQATPFAPFVPSTPVEPFSEMPNQPKKATPLPYDDPNSI